VAHIDGSGLFWVIELVKDASSGELYVPEDRHNMGVGDLGNWPVQIVTKHCLERGVFITGFVPNTLRLGPPLTLTTEECDEGIGALDYALTKLHAERG
jgi:taurine--2-oxoglutarate transaminase